MYSTIYSQSPTPAAQQPQTVNNNSAQQRINKVLMDAVNIGASDIHLTAGLPPMIRHDGNLQAASSTPLTSDDTKLLIEALLSTDPKSRMHRTKDADFTYTIHEFGRFRVNAYYQRGTLAAAIRPIPTHIPSIESLRLPSSLSDLTRCQSGLILVTGTSGCGKSTTMAAMLDHINRERAVHILTIEDPIEFSFQNRRGMVNQREIGTDSADFESAVHSALREDPDIIAIGDVSNREAMQAALLLSETGHLVFASLNTKNAQTTIERFIDTFPADQRDQIRYQLAESLQAVISQQLIRKVSGGRIAAIEILTATSTIKGLIREGNTQRIAYEIETGHEAGMVSMDHVLAELVKAGFISHSDALEKAIDRELIHRYLTSDIKKLPALRVA
jgi:twitching motility protein PilT